MILIFVREPDNNRQFIDRFSSGNFNIHPGGLTRLKGRLFAGAVADANFGNIHWLFLAEFLDGPAAGEVLPGDRIGFVDSDHFSVLEQHRALANFGDRFEIVRDEEDGGAALDDRTDTLHAALLENEVTDTEHFIDDSTSGSTCAATEKPRRAYIPEE